MSQRSASIRLARWLLLALAWQIPTAPVVAAEQLRVAVAANFRATFIALQADLAEQTGVQATPIFGSSGLLFAQITQGAPFDMLLSADRARPQALFDQGFASAAPETYVRGRLALWTPNRKASLEQLASGRTAIAKPELAPYGAAARECLKKLGLWQTVAPHMVYGTNIAQTFQFVYSRGVDQGFVALAQLISQGIASDEYWIAPADCHQPIEQQAVIIRESASATRLLAFLLSESTQQRLQSLGYSRESSR